jgi:hypothetical protein
MPASSRLRSASSPTFGMSRVISSGPSLVSRAGDLVFLDVDRGEDVVAHDALRDQDRVLEVVAVPRHEGDEHVAAQRQLAQIGRGAVGDHLALRCTASPTFTSGRWLMQVFWFERWNLRSR